MLSTVSLRCRYLVIESNYCFSNCVVFFFSFAAFPANKPDRDARHVIKVVGIALEFDLCTYFSVLLDFDFVRCFSPQFCKNQCCSVLLPVIPTLTFSPCILTSVIKFLKTNRISFLHLV